MPEPDTRPKAVFDTGTILQAALSDTGPAFQCLRLFDAGIVVVLLSPQVRDEYDDVLTRPSICAKNPQLTVERAQELLAQIEAKAEAVTALKRRLEYPRDPDDEPILSLAIDAGADFIVARDKDLLELGQGQDFRLLFPALRIVDPVTFLRLMAALIEPEE